MKVPLKLQIPKMLFGLLKRSKTSGADKAVSVLPVYVANDAWVAEDWLWEGMALWQESSLVFARDYWLCLPNKDFSGTCGKRARYTHARGFSKALLAGLKAPGGGKLLDQHDRQRDAAVDRGLGDLAGGTIGGH